MLQVPTNTRPIHPQVITVLARLRQEWQEATEGASLLETNGNIGLILADLINGFGFGADDQRQILGTELLHELKDFLYTPKQS
jgi:hypothetical protein